jgi:DNA-directed RNA polymerase subunit RPC12/RpoP
MQLDRIRNPDKDVCFKCGKWFYKVEMVPIWHPIHAMNLLHCKKCANKVLNLHDKQFE